MGGSSPLASCHILAIRDTESIADFRMSPQLSVNSSTHQALGLPNSSLVRLGGTSRRWARHTHLEFLSPCGRFLRGYPEACSWPFRGTWAFPLGAPDPATAPTSHRRPMPPRMCGWSQLPSFLDAMARLDKSADNETPIGPFVRRCRPRRGGDEGQAAGWAGAGKA